MKKMFSQIFKSLLLNRLQRFAMVIVFLSFTAVAAAWEGTATFTAKVSNTGNGKVYVSNQQTSPTDISFYTDAEDGSIASVDISSSSATVTRYFHAMPTSDEYTFAGWSKNFEGTNPTGKSGMSCTLTGTENEKKPSITYYAVFKSIYDIPITLKAAENGTYTATHTTNALGSHTYKISTADVSIEDIDSKQALTVTFKATPASGYSFLRWKFVENPNTAEEKVTYEYTNPKAGFQKEFTEPTDVYVEFAPAGKAIFIVKGNEDQTYLKLSDAINAAKNSSSKVIVTYQSGELYEETESVANIYDATTKTYTIPEGITLLVPGDDNYTVRIGEIILDDFDNTSTQRHKLHTRLTIPSGIKLQFNGNLCVYAKLWMNGTVYCNCLPLDYGMLHLNDGAQIILNDGAVANIYGYVTGNINDNTKVHAKSGSHVYEMMQVRDYRGGGGSSSCLKTGVFIFNHYFIQNIETTLQLEWGAYESVSCGFDISDQLVFETAVYVAPREGDNMPEGDYLPGKNEESALFYMGKGTVIKKYLDRTNDKQRYEISSDEASLSIFDKIYLKLLGMEVNSSEFVLPITTNMDMHIQGKAIVEAAYDIALLAGSKLTIDEHASLRLNKNLFVYDKDELSVEFKGNSNLAAGTYNYYSHNQSGPLKLQLSYQSSTPTITWNDSWLNDATIDVNGTLQGAIYTTQGGASIISSAGTGKVSFSTLSSNQKTYQVLQYKVFTQTVTKVEIPITSAKLQNGDKLYSAGEGTADNGKTYKYYPLASNGEGQAKGRWLAGVEDGIELQLVNNNSVTTKIPESKDMLVQFTPELSENLSITSFSTDVQGANFVKTDGKETQVVDGVYSVPVTFTPTGTHDAKPEGKIIITFNCSNSLTGENPQIVKEIPLDGQEYYLPEFSILGDGVTEGNTTTYDFGTLEVGSSKVTKGIKVQTVEHTVTDRTYNSGQGYATWTLPSVSTPFTTSAGNYFDATTFSIDPATTAVGSYEQELTITAKYSEGVETTKTIVLRANIIKQSNSLAFIDDLKSGQYTIYQGQVINNIFANNGNGSGISCTYNGVAADPNGLVVIDANGKGIGVVPLRE